MTEQKIDHTAEAVEYLNDAARYPSNDWPLETGETKADRIAAAQVHATLAVAEQLRIANLIAFVVSVQAGITNELPDRTVMRRVESAGAQIIEGLGLK